MKLEKSIIAGLGELLNVAEELIQFKGDSKIIIFKGELGAGKTTLIKNICNFLHSKDDISSPTFSLVNEYQTKEGEVIYHFDFYRIREEEEALDMGCEDYFYSGHLCLIEWPEKIASLLPDDRIEVEIEVLNDKRTFNFKRIQDVR